MAMLEYEIHGLDAFHMAEALLRERGYTDRTDGPGSYSYQQDAAPGWSGWYYWLAVCESPDKPIRAELDALLK